MKEKPQKKKRKDASWIKRVPRIPLDKALSDINDKNHSLISHAKAEPDGVHSLTDQDAEKEEPYVYLVGDTRWQLHAHLKMGDNYMHALKSR